MRSRSWWQRRRLAVAALYCLALAGHQLGGFARPDVGFSESRSQGPSGAPAILVLDFDPGRQTELDRQLDSLADADQIWRVDLRALARNEDVASYTRLAQAAVAQVVSERSPEDRSALTVVGIGDAAAVALHALGDPRLDASSLVLWSANGVQEFDLLGSYEMDHVLYSLEWALLTTVNEFVPHFGLLRDAAVLSQTARIRMQSDRRRLRPILESIQIPVLIVHHADDFHTGVAVAREHARIVPQSKLCVVDSGQSDWPRLSDWIRKVRSQEATDGASASIERVAESRVELGREEWVRARGRTLYLLLFLLVLGTFITEDLTSIAAGLLIADGRLSWAQGLGAVFCGIYFGDQSLYLIGRVARRNVVHRRPWKWFLRAEDLDRAARWFEQRGLVAILLTRFIPGTRLPTYVAAGVVRAGYWRFAAYFFVAVALWTPLLVGFSARVGAEALGRLQDFRKGSLLVFVALALAILLLLRLVVPLCTDRGRRRLWAQWQRIRHWEFWPPALIYAPVILKILGFARRHGGLRVVTAVNPGMPASGLLGESKADILDALGGVGASVPLYRRIRAGSASEQRAEVDAFLDLPSVELPIVIKPDQGERGQGVAVLHDLAALDELLVGSEMDWIAQAYVGGLEFGVFYVRDPGASEGRILSVNTKERLRLVGDGEHNLEHLILHHPRAAILADVHLRANAARLHQIPPQGAAVEIVEIGAHARGTVFRDARHLITPELTSAIERISRRFEGFYFGRYDLRVPDETALREGRDLWILELNGLTSEAAHIYDPRFTLRQAQRSLAEQWQLAFEIGAENVAAGHRVESWRMLLKLWLEHRQQGRQRPATP